MVAILSRSQRVEEASCEFCIWQAQYVPKFMRTFHAKIYELVCP